MAAFLTSRSRRENLSNLRMSKMIFAEIWIWGQRGGGTKNFREWMNHNSIETRHKAQLHLVNPHVRAACMHALWKSDNCHSQSSSSLRVSRASHQWLLYACAKRVHANCRLKNRTDASNVFLTVTIQRRQVQQTTTEETQDGGRVPWRPGCGGGGGGGGGRMVLAERENACRQAPIKRTLTHWCTTHTQVKNPVLLNWAGGGQVMVEPVMKWATLIWLCWNQEQATKVRLQHDLCDMSWLGRGRNAQVSCTTHRSRHTVFQHGKKSQEVILSLS